MKRRVTFRRILATILSVLMMTSMLSSGVMAASLDNGTDTQFVEVQETEEVIDEEVADGSGDDEGTLTFDDELTEESLENEEVATEDETEELENAVAPKVVEEKTTAEEALQTYAGLEPGTRIQSEPVVLTVDEDQAPEGFGWAWDASELTLHLNCATFEIEKPVEGVGYGEDEAAAIRFPEGEITISVEGASSITSETAAFFLKNGTKINIVGGNTLTVNVTPDDYDIYAIAYTDKSTINVSDKTSVIMELKNSYSKENYEINVSDESSMTIISNGETFNYGYGKISITEESELTLRTNSEYACAGRIGTLEVSDNSTVNASAQGESTLNIDNLYLKNGKIVADGTISTNNSADISDHSYIECTGRDGNQYYDRPTLYFYGNTKVYGESEIKVSGDGHNTGNLLQIGEDFSLEGSSRVTLDAGEGDFYGIRLGWSSHIYISENSQVDIKTSNIAVTSDSHSNWPSVNILDGGKLNIYESGENVNVFNTQLEVNVDNGYLTVDVPENNTTDIFGQYSSGTYKFPTISINNASFEYPEGVHIGQGTHNNDQTTLLDSEGNKIREDFRIVPNFESSSLYAISNPASSLIGSLNSNLYTSVKVGILNPGTYTNDDISYQWYEENQDGDILLQGATDSTFKIPTEKLGRNKYYCVVTLGAKEDEITYQSTVCSVKIIPSDKSRIMTRGLNIREMTSSAEDAQKGWKWDYEHKKLTLNNVYMDIPEDAPSSYNKPLNLYSEGEDLTVEIIGECYLYSAGYNYAIEDSSPWFDGYVQQTNFVGDGILHINSDYCGIWDNNSNLNLDVKCDINSKYRGIYIGRNLTINKEINISSECHGIELLSSDSLLKINDNCNISVYSTDGWSNIYSASLLPAEINADCNFTNTSTGNVFYGYGSVLNINDSTIRMNAPNGTGLYAAGVKINHSSINGETKEYFIWGNNISNVEISDSTINAVSASNAIYSRTTLSINNSDISVTGKGNYNGSLLYSDENMYFNNSDVKVIGQGAGTTLIYANKTLDVDNSSKLDLACTDCQAIHASYDLLQSRIINGSSVKITSTGDNPVDFAGKINIAESSLEIQCDGTLGRINYWTLDNSRVILPDGELQFVYDAAGYGYKLADSDGNYVKDKLLIEPVTTPYLICYGIDVIEDNSRVDNGVVHSGKDNKLKAAYSLKNTEEKASFTWYKYDYENDTYVEVPSSVEGYNTDTLTISDSELGQAQYKCKISAGSLGAKETDEVTVVTIPANREIVDGEMDLYNWGYGASSDDSHWETQGWKWDRDTMTLTISGMYYISDNAYIYLPTNSTIKVEDDSFNFFRTKGYSIYANGNLTINGNGLLWVNGGYKQTSYDYTIAGVRADSLTVDKGIQLFAIAGDTDNVFANENAGRSALWLYKGLISNAAYIHCKTYDPKASSIKSYDDLVLNHAVVTYPENIYFNDNKDYFYKDEEFKEYATDILIEEDPNPYVNFNVPEVEFKNIDNVTAVGIIPEYVHYSNNAKFSYEWYSVEDLFGTAPILVSTSKEYVPKAELGEKIYFLKVTVTDKGETNSWTSDMLQVFVLPKGRKPIDSLLVNEHTESVDNMSEYGYKYDKSQKKLTLDDAVIYSAENSLYIIPGMTIELTNGSVNYMYVGNDAGSSYSGVIMTLSGSATEEVFTGNGKLIIENYGPGLDGIWNNNNQNLKFTGGIDVDMKLYQPDSNHYAIRTNGSIILDNATLNIDMKDAKESSVIYMDSYRPSLTLKNNSKLVSHNNKSLVCTSRSSYPSINIDTTSVMDVEATEADALGGYDIFNDGTLNVKSHGDWVGIFSENQLVNNGVINASSEKASAIYADGSLVNNACGKINATNAAPNDGYLSAYQCATLLVYDHGYYQSSDINIHGVMNLKNEAGGSAIGYYRYIIPNWGFRTEPTNLQWGLVSDYYVLCEGGDISKGVHEFHSFLEDLAVEEITVNDKSAYADYENERIYYFEQPYNTESAVIRVKAGNENTEVYINGSTVNNTVYTLKNVSYGESQIPIKLVYGEDEREYTLNIFREKAPKTTVYISNESEIPKSVTYSSGTSDEITMTYNTKRELQVGLDENIIVSYLQSISGEYDLWAIRCNGQYIQIDYDGKASVPVIEGAEYVIDDNCFMPKALNDLEVEWDPTTDIGTAIVKYHDLSWINSRGQYWYYKKSPLNPTTAHMEVLVYDIETGEEITSARKTIGYGLTAGSMYVGTDLDPTKSYKFVIRRKPYSNSDMAYPSVAPEELLEQYYGTAILEPRVEPSELVLTDTRTDRETDYYSVKSGNAENVVIDTGLPESETIAKTLSFTFLNAEDENNIVKITNNTAEGTISLQGINPGTAYIVVGAKMYGKNMFKQIRVDVFDPDESVAAPELKLLSNTATLNIYSTYDTGYATAPQIRLSYVGDSADRLESAEFENETLNTFFSLNKIDDRTFAILPNENYDFSSKDNAAAIKALKSSYKTNILVATTKGKELRSAGAFTLKVTKKLPSVKVTAVKLNSFYEDASAKLQFTCKEGAVTAAVVDESKATAKTPACPTWLNYDENNMSVGVDGINGKYSGKLYLLVDVEGYNTPVAVAASVSVAKSALKAKLAQSSLTVPANINQISEPFTVGIVSSDKKVALKDYNITDVFVANEYNLYNMTAANKKAYANSVYYKVEAFDAKTGEIKLVPTDAVSREKEGVLSNGKIMLYAIVGNNNNQLIELPLTVKAAAKMSAKASKTTIKLDMAKGIGVDEAKTTIVPGVSGMKVGKFISYGDPNNTLDVKIMNYKQKVELKGYLDVSYDADTKTFTFRSNGNTDSGAPCYYAWITTESGVTIKVKIAVSCKVPTYKVSTNKVTLNKEVTGDMARVTVTPSVEANTKVEYYPTDSKGKKLTNEVIKIHPSILNGVPTFDISLGQSAEYGTTYKVNIQYRLKDYEGIVTKPIVITVSVPKKEKSNTSVKVKTSNYIDLYRPKTMGVKVTPTFTNTNYVTMDDTRAALKVTAYNGKKVAEGEYIGENGDVSKWFTYQNGIIFLNTASEAYKDNAINTAYTYKFTLTYYNKNDVSQYVTTPLTALQVKAGKVTVAQSKKTISLNKYDRNDREYIIFSVADQFVSDFNEVKISTAAGKVSNYELVKIADGVYAIGFKGRTVAANIKSGSIKIEFWFDGVDSTKVKAATSVNVKINH